MTNNERGYTITGDDIPNTPTEKDSVIIVKDVHTPKPNTPAPEVKKED